MGHIDDRCPKGPLELGFEPMESFTERCTAPPLVKIESQGDGRFDTYAVNLAHHEWFGEGEAPSDGNSGLIMHWAWGAKARFSRSLNAAQFSNWYEAPPSLAADTSPEAAAAWSRQSQKLSTAFGQTVRRDAHS